MSTNQQEYGVAAGISMLHGQIPSKTNSDKGEKLISSKEPMKKEVPKQTPPTPTLSSPSLHGKPVGSNRSVFFH